MERQKAEGRSFLLLVPEGFQEGGAKVRGEPTQSYQANGTNEYVPPPFARDAFYREEGGVGGDSRRVAVQQAVGSPMTMALRAGTDNPYCGTGFRVRSPLVFPLPAYPLPGQALREGGRFRAFWISIVSGLPSTYAALRRRWTGRWTGRRTSRCSETSARYGSARRG